MDQFYLQTRLKDSFLLTKYLINLKSIDTQLINIDAIGSGSFGQVFRAIHQKFLLPLALKKTLLTVKERNNYKKKNIHPQEYTFLLMIKDLLTSKKTQNFLFVYGIFYDENCTVALNTKTKTSFCSITLMELADCSLSAVFIKENLQYNIFFQILSALYSLEKYYSILHNDIKAENILLKNTPSGGCWEYVADGRSYFVENLGFVALVTDFGVSRSFDPKYTTDGYLGERNAYIKNGMFEPFETNYFLSIDNKTGKLTKTKPYSFRWEEGKGTRNRFHKRFSYPSLAFLPPFEFFYDIQDLIRTFLGGKRLSQPDFHKGMPFLSNKFKEKLIEYRVERNFYSTKWKLNSIIYFSAKYMIREFIHQFKNPSDKIIDRFVL